MLGIMKKDFGKENKFEFLEKRATDFWNAHRLPYATKPVMLLHTTIVDVDYAFNFFHYLKKGLVTVPNAFKG